MLVGISSYLRHSVSVSAKHYDFSNIEKSARNRAAVVDLIGGKYSNRSSSQLCRLLLNRQSDSCDSHTRDSAVFVFQKFTDGILVVPRS